MRPPITRTMMRNMPPAPMEGGATLSRCACQYSSNLMAPQRIRSTGQKRAKNVNRCATEKTFKVVSSNTTPRTIRTKGPANERRRRGGATGGGATGLDIGHLGGWLMLTRIWGLWRWRRRRHVRRIHRGLGFDVSGCRSIALQQLHAANHEQKQRPRAPDAKRTHTVEQEQNADGEDDHRPHDVLRTAAIALAGDSVMTQQSPPAGEEPASQEDQDEGPEVMESEFENTDGMQQEQDAEADEDERSHWNLGSVHSFARTEAL